MHVLFFLVLCLSWQVLVVMTPFQSVLCRRFQFIVAELGVSFCMYCRTSNKRAFGVWGVCWTVLQIPPDVYWRPGAY